MEALILDENIEEGFTVNKNIALKALIFSLLFYLINTEVINKYLKEKICGYEEIIKTMIFALLFYFISLQIE